MGGNGFSHQQQQQQQQRNFVTWLSMSQQHDGDNDNNNDEDDDAVAEEDDPNWNNNNNNHNPSLQVILNNLNPSQIQAVTKPAKAITRVIAGPGSGKTRVLTCRIAYLLLEQQLQQNQHEQLSLSSHVNNERILAVTFTRKAAGEMQHRVEKLLTETARASSISHDASSMENDDNDNDERIVIENFGGDGSGSSSFDEDGIARALLSRVTLGTFHSVCSRILRWNGDLLDSLPSVTQDMMGSENATCLDGGFAILDQGEQLRIVKDCLDDAHIQLSTESGVKVMSILTAIGRCKAEYAEGKNPFAVPDRKKPLSKVLQITQKVYPLYREKLLSTNCLDYDDLIYMTRELLQEYDDLRKQLQRRWKHVLVDEFQDTSKSQMDLIKLLTSESLFVVGDADQSIYSWRGAHVGSLADFESEFQHVLGKVHTVHLMENYRSTSNIVKAAQKVISSDATKSNTLRQKMIPQRGSGAAPRILSFDDEKAEAEYVVKNVSEAVATGKYGRDYSVAFIYRTNAQSRALEEACVRYNLPYVIFGSAASFYKRQEIKDCLCFLRWMHNGRDRSSMIRAMKTPARGIGDVALQEFDKYCEFMDEYFESTHSDAPRPTPLDIFLSLSDDARFSEDTSPSNFMSSRALRLMAGFSRQLRAIHDFAYQRPVMDVITKIIDDLGILAHLDKISKSKIEFEERVANVRELQKAAERYSKEGPSLVKSPKASTGNEEGFAVSPLGSFLDDVALVTEMADDALQLKDDRFVVNLMTIHASKGMEFDSVFLVGNEDGTLPTQQAIWEGEGSVQLEEEKRLCYVAMTRAKTELVLTWRRQVPVFTPTGISWQAKTRSRFLDILVAASKGNKQSLSTKATNTNFETPAKKVPNGANKAFSTVARSQSPSKFAGNFAKDGKSWQNGRNDVTTKHRSSWNNAGTERKESSSTSTASYSGTTSVYSRPNPVLNSSAGRTNPRRDSSEVPRALQPKVAGGRAADSSAAQSQANVKKTRPTDSTWFFPVGSQVKHKTLGTGLVLPPPPPESSGDMPVLVKFKDGSTQKFQASGSDLSPILF